MKGNNKSLESVKKMCILKQQIINIKNDIFEKECRVREMNFEEVQTLAEITHFHVEMADYREIMNLQKGDDQSFLPQRGIVESIQELVAAEKDDLAGIRNGKVAVEKELEELHKKLKSAIRDYDQLSGPKDASMNQQEMEVNEDG